jgi:hypothetical protein
MSFLRKPIGYALKALEIQNFNVFNLPEGVATGRECGEDLFVDGFEADRARIRDFLHVKE